MSIPVIPATARRLAPAGIALATAMLAGGVGACGRSTMGRSTMIADSTVGTAPPGTGTAPPPTTAAPTTAAPPPPEPPPEPTIGESVREDAPDPAPAPRSLRLHDDGLGPAGFGMSEGDVVEALRPSLGAPRRNRSRANTCGGWTVAEWPDAGITAFFNRGRFEGWRVTRAGRAATGKGIRVGSTVGDVRSAYADRFEWLGDSDLDHEFAVDRRGRAPFLGGQADGKDGDDRVERLWAGYTCSAR